MTTLSCTVFAINEDSEDYSVGYEDGWIEGYNEAESEYEDDYSDGYWDGYADAEKEIREQYENDSLSDNKNNSSKELTKVFFSKEMLFIFAGITILSVSSFLLYHDKLNKWLYVILLFASVLLISFHDIFN